MLLRICPHSARTPSMCCRRSASRSLLRVSLFVALSLLFSCPAHADAYEAAIARAVVEKERALDSNDPVSWELALSRFLEVRSIEETKEAMYELGFVASKLRQDDLAVESYEVALALGLSGAPQRKATEFLALHSGNMTRLDVRGPARTVLFVAGRQRGILPLARPLVLFPGTVLLRAEMVDDQRVERRLVLETGASISLSLAPDDVSAPAPAPVSVRPTLVASGAQLSRPTPPRASAPTRSRVARDASPLSVVGSDSPGASQWTNTAANLLLWTGGALTVLSVVAVPVSNAALEGAREDLKTNCPQPAGDTCPATFEENQAAAQEAVDGIATYQAMRTGAWVGVGVGAAMVVTGLGIKLLGADGSGTALRFAVSPGAARIWVQRTY